MTRRNSAQPLLALCAACVVFMWPTRAFAWKMETHVWIAQQVLNDLLEDDRCALTIVSPELQADGTTRIVPHEFFVEQGICASLRLHQSEYRTGAVGPDGFPDLATGQVTVHPGNAAPSDAGAWSTDRWLRHLLDFFPTNQGYRAFVYGFLSHAAADVFAHSYINTYTGDIFNLQGETEAELRHVTLEDYIKSKMPPIRNNAPAILQPYDIVADPAGELVSSLLPHVLFYQPDAIEQYRQNPATRHLAAMYDFRRGLYTARQKLADLQTAANAKISSFEDQIDDLTCSDWMWFVDPLTCTTLKGTRLGVETSLGAARGVNTVLVESVAKPLDAWIVNVDSAIRDYFRMSQRVSIEIMRGGNPRGEVEHWLCHSAPAFIGIPGLATGPGCAANSAVDKFESGISSVRAKMSENLGLLDWLVDPQQKVNEIVSAAIEPTFKDLGVQLVTSLLGDDSVTASLLTYRTTSADASGLKRIFEADESDTGLLAIGDIAQRVDADMHVSDGHFDPMQFNAIYNAVVLSKLALLSGAELNRLASLAGVTTTIYGSTLYPANAQPLLGVFRSIDGNHQWQEYGIPSPRVSAQPDSKTAAERQYGMPAVSIIGGHTSGGFRFWQDCTAREAVFKKMFRGPLTPGIEDLLAPADPNRSSDENPFPFAPESRTECTGRGVTLETLPTRGFGAVHTEVTSPPTLRLPPDVVVEATGAAGAAVNYGSATATDSAGISVGVTCSPASGAVFPLGITTVSCTATGTSGSTATGTFKVSVVDTTPPVVTVQQTPPRNANGWNNTDVVLTFTATDAVSQPVTCAMTTLQLEGRNPLAVTLTTEGAAQRVRVSCVDHEDNRSFAAPVVNIDKTPPVVETTRQPAANASGWNNTNVEGQFVAHDALSGIQGTAMASLTFAAEGGGQSAARSFQDRAGNTAHATIAGINIDKTPPTIEITGLTANGGYTAGCVPTPTFIAADALSGVGSSNGALTGGNGNGVGGFTYAVTASDLAGNVATRAASFTVGYNFRGFFAPVANDGSAIFRLNRTVPFKFQLARCDGSIVTNAVARLIVTRLTNVVLGTGDPIEVDSAGNANTDNLFRLGDGVQYIYNLSTQPLAEGTYRFQAVLDDGSVHAVIASLKSR